jgi:F-type H+-transporting ATPase subunit gamma
MVVTSDTGLCSTYNHNVLRIADEFCGKLSGKEVRIIAVGKEAFSHFRRERYPIENSYLGLRGKFSERAALDMKNALIDIFINKRSDEIYIAYTKFSSNLKHRPVVDKFLPVAYGKKERQYYLLEPDKEEILDGLVSRYLLDKVRVALLDALTAEHSARMLAMKLATDNADELIDTLTLLKNKARQAAITTEVLEIAMSAEALRG